MVLETRAASLWCRPLPFYHTTALLHRQASMQKERGDKAMKGWGVPKAFSSLLQCLKSEKSWEPQEYKYRPEAESQQFAYSCPVKP